MSLTEHLENTIGHLGAALNQQSPSDDKVIMDHVQSAYHEAKIVAEACQRRWISEVDRAAALEADVVKLRAALKASTGELENLFAMVEGEAPTLLEDHHSYPNIVNAIERGNAILSQGASHA